MYLVRQFDYYTHPYKIIIVEGIFTIYTYYSLGTYVLFLFCPAVRHMKAVIMMII